MQAYFHGSNTKLEPGTVLRGRGEAYRLEWSSLGPAYELLESRKPDGMISHHEGVFMCSENEDKNNDYGLDDIDCCGGGTEYICLMKPIGVIEKHDMNQMPTAVCLFDTLDELDSNSLEYKEVYQQIVDCIDDYWNGVASGDPLWEYIAREAEIIEVHPFEDYVYKPKKSVELDR